MKFKDIVCLAFILTKASSGFSSGLATIKKMKIIHYPQTHFRPEIYEEERNNQQFRVKIMKRYVEEYSTSKATETLEEQTVSDILQYADRVDQTEEIKRSILLSQLTIYNDIRNRLLQNQELMIMSESFFYCISKPKNRDIWNLFPVIGNKDKLEIKKNFTDRHLVLSYFDMTFDQKKLMIEHGACNILYALEIIKDQQMIPTEDVGLGSARQILKTLDKISQIADSDSIYDQIDQQNIRYLLILFLREIEVVRNAIKLYDSGFRGSILLVYGAGHDFSKFFTKFADDLKFEKAKGFCDTNVTNDTHFATDYEGSVVESIVENIRHYIGNLLNDGKSDPSELKELIINLATLESKAHELSMAENRFRKVGLQEKLISVVSSVLTVLGI